MKLINLFYIAVLTFSLNSVAEVKLGKKEILIDNDTLQLVRLTYPAGSESGMHEHKFPSRSVYFVKGGKLELVPADKTKPSRVMEVSDGDSAYMPAMKHNVRNIGTTEVVIIENEVK